MKFYHVTPASNVKSILKIGLKSSGSRGIRATYKRYWDFIPGDRPQGFIWAESSPEESLSWMDNCGTIDCKNWALLELNLPSSYNKRLSQEGITIGKSTVDPKLIKVLSYHTLE